MSQDPNLLDNIKWHFARKSAAQLREIVQTGACERWSAEAVAAAQVVLQERAAGRAQEPLTAEEERPPPSVHYNPDAFALGVLGGFAFGLPGILASRLVAGPVIIRNQGGDAARNANLPVPFGPKLAWLALDTTDTEAVATSLGLQGTRESSWRDGIEAANHNSVFVTPPLGDWTLAVGIVLFPPEQGKVFVKPLLERLSRQFGEAQYFCTHRDIELHLWARARQGRLLRGYGWLGEKQLTLWNEGRPTKEERDLGFQFTDGQAPPDEDSVLQLASLWSIAPTTLDEQFKEPSLGIVGIPGGVAGN